MLPPRRTPHVPWINFQGTDPSRGRTKEGESNGGGFAPPNPPPALPPGRRMKNSNKTTLQTPGPSRAPSTCGCRVPPGRSVAASPQVGVPTAPLVLGQRPAPRHRGQRASPKLSLGQTVRVKNVLFFFPSAQSLFAEALVGSRCESIPKHDQLLLTRLYKTMRISSSLSFFFFLLLFFFAPGRIPG